DLLAQVENCAACLWNDRAELARIDIENLPIPRAVSPLFVQPEVTRALEVNVDSQRHVIIPIDWSGTRFRSGRFARSVKGADALWAALPMLVITCLNLFR